MRAETAEEREFFERHPEMRETDDGGRQEPESYRVGNRTRVRVLSLDRQADFQPAGAMPTKVSGEDSILAVAEDDYEPAADDSGFDLIQEQVLMDLTPFQREVFFCVVGESLSQRAAAERLACSRRRVRTAVRQIREAFEKEVRHGKA